MYFLFQLLDYFFVVIHTFIVLFNLFGWLWARYRKWNLALLLLTGLSWFGLGVFFGWGYCPLTDWHFKLLAKLGVAVHESSYIAYLLNRLLGINVPENLADIATLLFYFSALIVSTIFNLKGAYRKNA